MDADVLDPFAAAAAAVEAEADLSPSLPLLTLSLLRRLKREEEKGPLL